MKKLNYLFITATILIFACSDGVEPETENGPTGFSGKITFIGEWPTDVTQTHIVLFKDPLNSVEDFDVDNLKFVSDSISSGVTTFNYNSADMTLYGEVTAGEYSYLAIAQSNAPVLSLTRDAWVVVGLYPEEGSATTPGKLIVQENKITSGVDIVCDFNNPPPQPAE